MRSDVSVERRLRFQELAISRLMSETRLLRDENAWLLARLEAAREPIPAVGRGDCLETTLPAGPGAPAVARAALTRWLTGQVPGHVLADARRLTSELVANSGSLESAEEEDSLQFAVQLRDGALRVDVRDPRRSPAAGSEVEASRFDRRLVEALTSRWGVDETDGTHLWSGRRGAEPRR